MAERGEEVVVAIFECGRWGVSYIGEGSADATGVPICGFAQKGHTPDAQGCQLPTAE